MFRKVEFQIENENIREEFDSIKGYFANILGKKKIQVQAKIKQEGDEITVLEAHSNEIQRITSSLIDNLRIKIMLDFVKEKGDSPHALFTLEQGFNNKFGNGLDPKTLFQGESDFFQNLLKVKNSKHYLHLNYLAENHAHKIMKLRFVFNPFSFIFLIEGDESYNIIWETLNTREATYVWQVEKNTQALKNKVKEVSETIGFIKAAGKKTYISLEESDAIRVFHDYSDQKKGFEKWKKEMEAIF